MSLNVMKTAMLIYLLPIILRQLFFGLLNETQIQFHKIIVLTQHFSGATKFLRIFQALQKEAIFGRIFILSNRSTCHTSEKCNSLLKDSC